MSEGLSHALLVGWLEAPFVVAFLGAVVPMLGDLPLLLCCIATGGIALQTLLSDSTTTLMLLGNHGVVLQLDPLAAWFLLLNAVVMVAVRLELRGTGIHVVLIEPGPIDTKIRINSRPQFKKWIDWQNSAHRTMYETRLIPRLEAEQVPTRFELPPSAVVTKLIHALEAPRPQPRYYVTFPTHVMGLARRLLPTRLMDALADRASS